ncbi:hypothetical protein J7E70_33140 [Variovorax paradoxus]|nr:hypothetical protein [Variovorax paradoxus]
MAPIIVAMARPLAGAEGLEDKDCELMSNGGRRLVEACARAALACILPHPIHHDMDTVTDKNESQEIFMYPTFRTQGTTMPTFMGSG